MRVLLRCFLLLNFSFSLFSMDGELFSGIWKVDTLEAIQVIQVYAEGFEHFTNAYLIREEFLEDPLRYVEFNFIDEDLLYITRADNSKLRGFYQFKENRGINSNDFPFYILLEDKYTNSYYFPVRFISDNLYEINYNLELNLRDQLIQIRCIALISRENPQ